jgi:hypothetical protein
MPISSEENIELDKNGQVNWRVTGLRETGRLQMTDPEWYRMMFFGVHQALMPINSDAVMHIPPSMAPSGAFAEQHPPQPQQTQTVSEFGQPFFFGGLCTYSLM